MQYGDRRYRLPLLDNKPGRPVHSIFTPAQPTAIVGHSPAAGAPMADFVIPPPAVIAVPVADGGAFPVRRVFCVGRNYAEHAREMGSDPDREPPFFFMKPADALVVNGADMPYPPQSKQLHHEMELVVALGEGGADIAAADALRYVWGYAAGLDMTRRDLQNAAKQEGK